MMICWQNEPKARPSFTALAKQLKDMENQHKVRLSVPSDIQILSRTSSITTIIFTLMLIIYPGKSILSQVQNIPKFKDRANWSRDIFQPMRSRACVYQNTNQNIAPVIKNFHNSGLSRTELKMSLQYSSRFHI